MLHVLVAQMLQHVVAYVITHAVSQATFMKRTKAKGTIQGD